MRIYTRTGDDGETSLRRGQRLPKDSLRLEALGTVDELNAAIGFAAALLREWQPPAGSEDGSAPPAPRPDKSELLTLLCRLQSDLLVAGADLSAPEPNHGHPPVPRVSAADVAEIERQIDYYTAMLPPLRHFILRTGTPAAAALHVACTVCRRAERRVVALNREEPVNPELLRYLNRLSDLLFTLARVANLLQGGPEIPWSLR
jgi:cob(I)alamin adenosyltransferase